MPQKPKKKQQTAQNTAQLVTLTNAESRMPNFIKYYKGIGIVPEEEWKHFFDSMFTSLPFSFRISENHRKFPNVYEGKAGTLGQAEVLREFMRNHVFPKLADVAIDEKPFEVTPLPWYPKQLAWKCNVDAKSISTTPTLKDFFDFLFQEERSGNVFKQEIASMIPALLVDVNSSHKVLEMCCAPGFQTSMIAEFFNSNPKKIPDGFIVANDTELNRINYRWSQGPSTFFTHEDGKTFPDLFTTEDRSQDSKVLYDRIFIDAPTSNDGNFRKNLEARGEWNVTKAQKHHKDLKEMLRRGLELLEVNGKLVYSTSSLNPVENEAVVAALLREAPETVELVDVKKRLPGLHTRPGMTSWKVMSQGLVFYETFESCPAWFKKENEETMFPPPEEEIATLNLDRCVRVMPHDNDTGAFFVAVLTKMGTLPWQKEEESMDTETAAEGAEGGDGVDAAGDAKKKKKSPYTKPIRCDININVVEIQWSTELTDEKLDTVMESEQTEYSVSPLKISKSCIPNWYQKKLEEYSAHFEDVEAANTSWHSIKAMFDIKKFDPVPGMLKFVQDGKGTSFFYMTPIVKTLIKSNPDVARRSKSHAGGLMVFKTSDEGKVDMCPFGHLPFLPYMTKRVVQLTKVDMLAILKEKAVMLKTLSEKTQKDLEAIPDNGAVYFLYEPKGKNADPKCYMLQKREKYKTYVKDAYFSKGDNHHNLRMCGINPLIEEEKADEEKEAME